MKIPGPVPVHLGYCTNVHPGDTVKDILRNLRRYSAAVKELVSPDQPMGIGLWISARAARELKDPMVLDDLKSALEHEQLYVFTLNGFPYGTFHGKRVKDQVYAPDWSNPKRLAHTKLLADHLTELLPDGEQGSISTVPVTWKPWAKKKEWMVTAIDNLAEMALYLYKLELKTGRRIHLGLEPEPTCFLETLDETVKFFKESLMERALLYIRKHHLLKDDLIQEILTSYLGVCVDTCHNAMQFEDSVQVLQTLQREEILISKVQLSACLEATSQPASLDALEPFTDPVYLHQVIGINAEGERRAWNDLPDALRTLRLDPEEAARLRVHYHVPFYWEGSGPLKSTRGSLYPAFWNRLLNGCCRHVEIETYTHSLLPRGMNPLPIHKAIAEEYQWVLERISVPA